MFRPLALITIFALLGPVVALAGPVTSAPKWDPTPLVLLDTKIYRTQDQQVVAKPRLLALSDHPVGIVVGNDEAEYLRVKLHPVVRTQSLISLRVARGENGKGQLVVLRPNEKLTLEVPGQKACLMEISAKILPDKVSDLL